VGRISAPISCAFLARISAKGTQAGDLLRSHDGQWVAVEEVSEASEQSVVYNLRISDYHTYFVGCRDWGFSVWAHNACHGNSLASAKPTWLYVVLDKASLNVLKWGITSQANPRRRYTEKFLVDKILVPLLQGTRSRMAQLERSLTQQSPGPLNFESWAGKLFPR
jgi:hypothetical protein